MLAIENSAIVLLRGTDDSEDWGQNASFLSLKTPDGAIHSGFHNAYQPLHIQIEKLLHRFNPKRVWITGHSLGGALAIVASYRLTSGDNPPIAGVMTFGQPMVVGSGLKDFMKSKLDGKYVLPEVDEIIRRFKECGKFAKKHRLRTCFHPDQFVVLNSPRLDVVEKSVQELEYQAEVAEWIGADVINIHGGGAYGDKPKALADFARNLDRLSARGRSDG
ncbi:lipase family protein [Schlesneria paludicola]|uniref:lipase family protein n=1 Tax=Schlesneria paludicola TaxID=360056 RepID=UPI0021BC1641|nr:TIM barrel protein [Schlesneria paludicola]